MGHALLIFSSFPLALLPGSERKKTNEERQNSRREGWTQIPADPKPLPVCPAPRLSPTGRAGPPANSIPPAAQPRTLRGEPVEDLQAEPPRGRLGTAPQMCREQTPESQMVGTLVIWCQPTDCGLSWLMYLFQCISSIKEQYGHNTDFMFVYIPFHPQQSRNALPAPTQNTHGTPTTFLCSLFVLSAAPIHTWGYNFPYEFTQPHLTITH